MRKLIILLTVEIILCVCITLQINCSEYNLWIDTTASVDVVISSCRKTSVNGNPDYKTVSISYLENDAVLEFKDYYSKIDKDDIINIKYNPDNCNDVIYLPYEEHCIAVKKRNTILLFLGAICITLVMYFANKKEN